MSRGGAYIDARPVLDGRQLKWTLERQQQAVPGLVRVDWLRCTVPMDAVTGGREEMADWSVLDVLDPRGRDLVRQGRGVSDAPEKGLALVRAGAELLLSMLPAGFSLGAVEPRGMDFYTVSAQVLHNGVEVGKVLAGGGRANQASTVHFNLYGQACLHIDHDTWVRLRNWLGKAHGHITRIDLALDRWQGGSVADVETAYTDGEFDVRGKRPTQRHAGCWTSGHSRTYYVGSRDTGKQFRGYEKGDEIFGPEQKDPWVRYEVEIRNNNRIIDLDSLSHPQDFFAGAYPFCQRMLDECAAVSQAKRIPTGQKLVESTAEGEVLRVLRWFKRTAAPTVAALLTHCGDAFEQIVFDQSFRTPARLTGWTAADLRKAFDSVSARIAPGTGLLQAGAA